MKQQKQLTEGTPWKLILAFSIPILIGNLFQLMYSLVDTKVVGMILGEMALSSVGSVSSVYNLLAGFMNGLTMGFSLVIARHFGARQYKELKNTFATSLVCGLVTTALIAFFMCLFLMPLMRLLQIPAEQIPMAGTYLRILVIGLFATFFYNYCANSLRAIGNAVIPLIFLSLASVLNVVMDFLFIGGFGMDVEGAAYATVLAQVIAAFLCFIQIQKKADALHIGRKDFHIHAQVVREIYKNGLSMALMNCLVAIGSVILQIAINSLGAKIIVAHTAARKVFEITLTPPIVLGIATAAYSGQNYGAHQYKRICQGVNSSFLLSGIWCAGSFVVCEILAKRLIGFLATTTDPEILYWGTAYVRFQSCFLFVCAVIVISRNVMQGYNEHVIPIVSSTIELIGKCAFTAISIHLLGYWGVILAEPLIWIAMVIPLLVRTIRFYKEAGFSFRFRDQV